ncbi:MAG: ribosome maturation factor RimP [Clostridia bacterium]
MQNKEICTRVSELAMPKINELGIELWDVDFEKEGSIYCLNIYLDGEREISIEDCEKVSRYVDPLLDAKIFDSMPPYTLCVASAGLERKLIKPSHFEKNIGALVHVGFYKSIDGVKNIEGTLENYNNDGVTINVDGKSQTYAKADVALVRLTYKF